MNLKQKSTEITKLHIRSREAKVHYDFTEKNPGSDGENRIKRHKIEKAHGIITVRRKSSCLWEGGGRNT